MSAQGMTLTVLATGLAQAVGRDEAPEGGGCDLSAGLYGPYTSAWLREVASAICPVVVPIDMVLHCPACGLQHIDAPDTNYDPHYEGHMIWDNPPHRSHLCHGCAHIWRPADVPTNGVQAIKTKGKADSPVAVMCGNCDTALPEGCGGLFKHEAPCKWEQPT